MNQIIITFIIFSITNLQYHFMNNPIVSYTKQDILNELDNSNNPFKSFPDFEDGYFHISGSRINLFADSTRWAIVFEQTGYHNRNLDVEIHLTYFGNCLINLSNAGINKEINIKYIKLIEETKLKKLEAEFEHISNSSKFINVRNTNLPIEHDFKKYKVNGINISKFNNPRNLIDIVSLIRYLDEFHSELFRANENELRTCLPKDLPKIMDINKWYHKNYATIGGVVEGEKPSNYETFQQISDVLINRNSSFYKPTILPNNDWRNWPNAGQL